MRIKNYMLDIDSGPLTAVCYAGDAFCLALFSAVQIKISIKSARLGRPYCYVDCS